METRSAAPFFTPETEALRFLPEGPRQLDPTAWPWPGNWLVWVGIQHGESIFHGSVNFLNLETRENRSFPLPGRPGFAVETNRPGMLFVGMEREIVLMDFNAPDPVLFHTGMQVIENDRTIINDGIPTPFGVIFGTKDLHFQDPLAHLYLYRNEEKALTLLRDGQTCSNGKIVLPRDGGWLLLDIDTPTRKLVRYELNVEVGTLGPPRILVDFSGEGHFPDGMRLTPDGKSLVVAFYNPEDVPYGVARQYNLETGAAEVEWQVPLSPRVTCPAFVVIRGAVKLLLTTADEGMTPAQQRLHPKAGAFFLGGTSFEGPLPPSPSVAIDGLLP